MKLQKFNWKTLVFLFPAFFIIFTVLLVPTLMSLGTSVMSDSGNSYVGFANYKNIFQTPRVLEALKNNIVWILIHLPLTMFLGLLFAVFFRKLPGGIVGRTAIFVGVVVPMVIGGVLVRFLFSGNAGLISVIFSVLDVEVLAGNWLAYPKRAFAALVTVSVWLWTGYTMLMYMAGLNQIPASYVEAARMDGATPLRIFFSITIPLLMPMTRVILFMTVLWELKLFDIVYVATGGGPGNTTNVLALEMYNTAFKYFRQGEGAAIAILLTALMIFPLIQLTRKHYDDIA